MKKIDWIVPVVVVAIAVAFAPLFVDCYRQIGQKSRDKQEAEVRTQERHRIYLIAEKWAREKLAKSYPGDATICLEDKCTCPEIRDNGHEIYVVYIRAAVFRGPEMHHIQDIRAYVIDGVAFERAD